MQIKSKEEQRKHLKSNYHHMPKIKTKVSQSIKNMCTCYISLVDALKDGFKVNILRSWQR